MNTVISKLKKIVLDRPLGCSCGALMVLTALLLFAPAPLKLCLLILSLIALPFLLVLRTRLQKGKPVALFFAVIFMLSALSCATSLWNYDLFDRQAEELALKEESVELEGYAESVVYESDLSCCYLIRVTSLDGKGVFGVKLLALFSPDDTPPLFRIFSAQGTLSSPQSTDPSFDGATYYRTKGVFAQFTPDSLSVTEKRPVTLAYPLHLMREKVNDLVEESFTERSAPLVKAILLGDKRDLSSELKRDFKTLGLSHLLAVSGLHLSVLFGMWSFLLLKLRVPLKARCLILAPSILLFCALCSFSLSVMRAAVMFWMILLSKMVNEENDSKTSLLFAGGLIVFISPFSVFDVGFLLSFFATFGILQIQPLLIKKKLKERMGRRLGRTIYNALALSFAAQIAVLPVAYLSFGSISVFSPVATLIFSPLFSALLYLAPITLLFSFVPLLSDLLSLVSDSLCALMEWGAHFARYVKEGLVSTNRPLTFLLLVILILLALLFLFSDHKKRFALLLGTGYLLFCALCIALPLFDPPQCLTDVNGKNDLMVLYDGGQSLLLDLSDGSKKNLRLSLQMLLEETGDLNPDALLLTHYHQRHLAAFEELCREYYPKRLYLSAPVNEREEGICENLCLIAQEHGVKVTVLEKNDDLQMGDVRIQRSVHEYLDRSTHPVLSFTVKIKDGAFTYLSSSAPEISGIQAEERVYLGVHGPVIKKPLDPLFQRRHVLLFATAQTAEKYGFPQGAILDREKRSLLFE